MYYDRQYKSTVFDKGSEVLEKSRTLKEYMQFVCMAREALEGKTSEEEKRAALSKVIDRCIAEERLADFLREHREEICSIAAKVSPEFDVKKIAAEYLSRHKTVKRNGNT